MAQAEPKPKEWTLMFWFASDNPLAPGVVAQLKAIKNAGYHREVNVVTQFDPFSIGTPTHIFDVSNIEKLKNQQPELGFGNDPFVRNMLLDRLWRDEKIRDGKTLITDEIRRLIDHRYKPPTPPPLQTPINPQTGFPTECDPKDDLASFLKFCREGYPAKRYILFILGHGLIVANDVFAFDAHATKPSITLIELGEILTKFRQKIDDDAELEMVGFNSCSLSNAEVAYELRGTANFMLASQGPSFVSSWPYRSILLRIFKDVDDLKSGKIKVKRILKKIFYYCLYNSTDYLFAGYSFDLCLANLKKVSSLKRPMRALSNALIRGLDYPDMRIRERVKELILLAHWESQSYWKENYTDLYDFCFSLDRRILKGKGKNLTGVWLEIKKACHAVRRQLVKEKMGRPKKAGPGHDNLIVLADFAGPAYQYSHGLSVYFPWSEPVADIPILTEYESYEFNETGWLLFLRKYFEATRRCTRAIEADPLWPKPTPIQDPIERDRRSLLEDIATLMYYSEGQLGGSDALPDPEKTGPEDPTGDACNCPSIKNYPRDLRPLRERVEWPDKDQIPLSPSFFDKDPFIDKDFLE